MPRTFFLSGSASKYCPWSPGLGSQRNNSSCTCSVQVPHIVCECRGLTASISFPSPGIESCPHALSVKHWDQESGDSCVSVFLLREASHIFWHRPIYLKIVTVSYYLDFFWDKMEAWIGYSCSYTQRPWPYNLVVIRDAWVVLDVISTVHLDTMVCSWSLKASVDAG